MTYFTELSYRNTLFRYCEEIFGDTNAFCGLEVLALFRTRIEVSSFQTKLFCMSRHLIGINLSVTKHVLQLNVSRNVLKDIYIYTYINQSLMKGYLLEIRNLQTYRTCRNTQLTYFFGIRTSIFCRNKCVNRYTVSCRYVLWSVLWMRFQLYRYTSLTARCEVLV